MKKRIILMMTIMVVAVTSMTFSSCASTPANGQLLFWVDADLGCGPIDVTVNGTTKQITSYYSSSTPDCDASGCATFSLAPGDYTVSASCVGTTWSFTKTVTSNTCLKTKLVP